MCNLTFKVSIKRIARPRSIACRTWAQACWAATGAATYGDFVSPLSELVLTASPLFGTSRGGTGGTPASRRQGLSTSGVVLPHRKALLALADRFGATDLWVFGSFARGEAGPDSDVDLLVRFEHPVGLFRRMEFKELAGQLLGRTVDLATEGNLHWLIRPTVLAEAVPV